MMNDYTLSNFYIDFDIMTFNMFAFSVRSLRFLVLLTLQGIFFHAKNAKTANTIYLKTKIFKTLT